jgi:hypothetical protein
MDYAIGEPKSETRMEKKRKTFKIQNKCNSIYAVVY